MFKSYNFFFFPILIKDKRWNKETSLGLTRAYATSVQLSSSKWWIAGGNNKRKTTEIYDADSETSLPFVDVPEQGVGHQIIRVNQTHFAYLTTQKFYLFNR